jgi:hypothetical protein
VTPEDLALEDRLELAYWRLQAATTTDERRQHWDELKRLHQLRRAERVAEMEAERGLT